ncbi:MAG TPA: ABC transporter ATP-binding protein [Rhizomicrobium sp.]|jgi:ATP-binding cassette subfamily C protein|nr:ABC transporter ATP-binding protein [Rhizomicrobium sp.]
MSLETDTGSAGAALRALWSLIRSIAAFAGRRGVFAAIYLLLGAVFESAGLILLIPLLGVVIGTGSGSSRLQRTMDPIFAAAGAATQLGRLALLLAGFAVIMVVRGVVIALRDSTVASLQIGYTERLRGDIASSLAAAGWNQVLRLRHARVMSVMSNDIQRIGMAASYLLQTCIAIVILVVQCVLSFILSPWLALLSLALLLASAVAMIPVLRRARAQGHFVSAVNVSLIDTASQFLSGLKLALSQDLQGAFVTEFQDTLHGLTTRQTRFFRQQTAARAILTTLTALVGAAVVLLGYGVLHLSAPLLIAFLLVVARMSGPAATVQQGFQQIALGLPAYEVIMTLVTELRATAQPATRAQRAVPDGLIALEHVGFRHPHTDDSGSHGVLDVSLSIPPGSFLGIAGTSGSGKTTLVDLLVGLLQPQTGRILVGGELLDDAMLASWRARLSYISQDSFLFHDTIRRNLLWARPDASEADMWDALTLAGADAIVRRIDGGLEAVVGERGSLVSGGERQRLALARALLRRPSLLVMDEATNAIDIDGERALLERLLAIEPRPIIVMIAHRGESLALCDQVLRMENGRLAG